MRINDYYLHVQRTSQPSRRVEGMEVPATVVSIYAIEDYENTSNIAELVASATPLAVGRAYLNPMDQMNRRRGLIIAGGRAAHKLGMRFGFTHMERPRLDENGEILRHEDGEAMTETVGVYTLSR